MSIGVGNAFALPRRTIRSDPNPMDVSTIVSIYPKSIVERKHTMEPGFFLIEAGSVENPSITYIGTSCWWRDVDPEQPLLEILMSSTTVAKSIITDWANGLFMCNMTDSMPGIFYVPGKWTGSEIRQRCVDKIKEADEKQKKYYFNLIQAADVLWARSNGNPLAISEDMKLAAEQLKLKDKPWLRDFSTVQMSSCPACGQLHNPTYPICAHCKIVIDAEKFKKMNLQFAQ